MTFEILSAEGGTVLARLPVLPATDLPDGARSFLTAGGASDLLRAMRRGHGTRT